MYDPDRHHRRSIRLSEFDYSQEGAYFVTICVHQWACLLGDVLEGQVRLSEFGSVVAKCWRDLPRHYDHIELGEFVVMPNHVHGVIVLRSSVGAGFKPAPTGAVRKRHGLPEITRALKTFSARRINALRGTPGQRFWQRSYYERVIRDGDEYDRTGQYILDNPVSWLEDKYHP